MNIQNYVFGIDVDNILTDTPPFSVDEMDLEETRKMIRNAPPKKGIEILSILDLNNYNRKRWLFPWRYDLLAKQKWYTVC